VVNRSLDTSGTHGFRGLFDSSRRTPTVLVALGGVLLSLVLSASVWSLEQAEAKQALDTRTQVLAHSIDRALSDVKLRLGSIAGFYQASEEVTELGFRRFVKKLGLLPGLDAIAYMPVVVDRNLAAYEERMRLASPGFSVFEVDATGQRIPPGDRRVHVPLQWYEPAEAFDAIEGFDSTFDPDRSAAMEHARLTRDLAVSPFVRLVSESETDGFLMYWPVTDSETEALTGYATAALDLSQLVEGAVTDDYLSVLDWEVADVTGGEPSSQANLAGVSMLEIGGRTWEIVITSGAASGMTPNPRNSLLLLGTGLLATLFIAGALENRRKQSVARQEYERLRELTQAKDQFLASVGHELRTPLTSVLGFAELLKSDHPDISDEERLSMIATVADEATDLASIVDDLLVAARSELELLVVTEVPVSARAQVAQVLETAGKDAADMIEVLGQSGNPYRAIGDPSRVRQILRNLITNACRYGGDRIQVRLSSRAQWVSTVVADNGNGVPEDDAGHIFDPYYRAHSIESQPAALGIGLSVARQLAILMHGDLTYRRQGNWTVFELLLPVAVETHEGHNGHPAMSNGTEIAPAVTAS